MENKYYYDEEYYSKEELYEMYQKLHDEQKKPFRDSLAHFTLSEILKKCDYDERYTNGILELARIEDGIIKMYGADCGTPTLAFRGLYRRNLRKLINLTGKLVSANDHRIDEFDNGEYLLNKLVSLTLGSYYAKDEINDLSLIDYNFLSKDECLAIADNFIRDMKDEEIVSYDAINHTRK